MSVTVILEADVKAGQKTALLKLLQTSLPETRQYKGFISIAIYSEQQQNKIVFFSKWQSIEDYQAYLQWRSDTGVMDMLAEQLNSAPLIRYFDTEISDALEGAYAE